MTLANKKCIPCEGGAMPLPLSEAEVLMKELVDWQLWPDGKTIAKSVKFTNFAQAFAFAAKVADLAEAEQHHPDLLISWGSVEIELSTHAIGGLSENDFILAAKIDKIQ